MKWLVLLSCAACSFPNVTFTDASASDATIDVSSDAPTDAAAEDVGADVAPPSCLDGGVTCSGLTTCCMVSSSPNYGMCDVGCL
jgi:hypothetical protein